MNNIIIDNTSIRYEFPYRVGDIVELAYWNFNADVHTCEYIGMTQIKGIKEIHKFKEQDGSIWLIGFNNSTGEIYNPPLPEGVRIHRIHPPIVIRHQAK